MKYTLRNIGLENWPYSEATWNETKSIQWYTIVANLVREGVVFADGFIELPIVNVEVGINDFNESFHSLKIDQPDFHPPFDRQTLLKNSVDDLNELVAQVRDFVTSNLKLDSDLVYSALYKSMEIEKIFATISDDSDNSKNVRRHGLRLDERNYTSMTINDLPDLPCAHPCDGGRISWPEFIKSLFEASSLPNAEIDSNDMVIVKNLNYINNLKSTLTEAKIQSWEWANYLGFKLLQTFQVVQQNVAKEFEDDCANYLISGKKISRFGLLHGAVGSMYVRKFFNDEKKKDLASMVNYMKSGFKECICKNPSFQWMDSETQTAALEKINAMDADIGYPPELVNRTLIDAYYDGRLFSNHIISCRSSRT